MGFLGMDRAVTAEMKKDRCIKIRAYKNIRIDLKVGINVEHYEYIGMYVSLKWINIKIYEPSLKRRFLWSLAKLLFDLSEYKKVWTLSYQKYAKETFTLLPLYSSHEFNDDIFKWVSKEVDLKYQHEIVSCCEVIFKILKQTGPGRSNKVFIGSDWLNDLSKWNDKFTGYDVTIESPADQSMF
jgi:hypothetical protein